MGSPLSAGIGTGSAQVFNTQNIANRYFQLLQFNQLKEQQEQQAIAKMLTQLTPDRLRVTDIPLFNQKYNELKGIYLNNKGLYSTPMKHVEAYKRATEIQNELSQLVAESKMTDEVLTRIGQQRINKPDEFEDDAVDLLKQASQLPVDGIKKLTGGRLLDITDFEFKAKPIDWQKKVDYIDQLARHTPGGATYQTIVDKHDGKNGIPLGKIQVRTDAIYHPAVVGSAVEHWFAEDSNFRKSYSKTFNATPPEVIHDLQNKIKEQFDGDFVINDAQSLAKADVLLHYSRLNGLPKREDDVEYKENLWSQQQAKRVQDQKKLIDFRNTQSFSKQSSNTSTKNAEKLTSNPIALAFRGLNGDEQILQTGTQVNGSDTDGGGYDLNTTTGGLVLKRSRNADGSYLEIKTDNLIVHPRQKKLTITDNLGQTHTYEGIHAINFLKSLSTLNGTTVDEMEKFLKTTVPKSPAKSISDIMKEEADKIHPKKPVKK
jgi:hypothetical protein